jgi:hypothetical protein
LLQPVLPMAEGGIVTPRHPDTDRPLREALRDLVILAGTTENPQDALDAADRLADTLGLRLPAEPEAPDPCDGCGASRLSMRHYIGCPMVATHRWDPVVGTWVASYPRRDILDRLMELWQEPWSEPAFGEAQMLLARLRHSQPVPTPEPPAEPDYNPHPNPFDENGDFLDGEFDEGPRSRTAGPLGSARRILPRHRGEGRV